MVYSRMPLQRAATGAPPGFGGFGAAPAAGFGAAPAAGFGAAPAAGFGAALTAAPNPGFGGFGAAPAAAPAAGFGAGFASPASPGFGLPPAAAAPATTVQFAPGTGFGSGHSTYAPFAGPGGATAFSQQYGALAPTMSPTSGAYMNALRNSRLGIPRTQPTLQNQMFNALQGTGRGNLHRAQYYAQNPGAQYTLQAAAASGQQMAQPAWRGWGGKSRRRRNKRKSTKRRRRTNRR